MATRFRFRLEPLLKLRKSLEQEARRQFAKAMEAREAAEAHLKEIQQQHKAGWQAAPQVLGRRSIWTSGPISNATWSSWKSASPRPRWT